MDEKELKKHFEEKYLRKTCFNTLEKVLEERTLLCEDVARALFAIHLYGVWTGLQELLT